MLFLYSPQETRKLKAMHQPVCEPLKAKNCPVDSVFLLVSIVLAM